MSLRLTLPAALAVAIAMFAAGGALALDLREMAGQMIVIGFQGEQADDAWPSGLRDMIARSEIGGVMYLRANVTSLARVAEMNRGFLAARPEPGLAPLIALDQEGGQIERLTEAVGFAEIPSAERVAATRSPEAAEALYADLAERLAGYGFNLNLGPVTDVDVNPANPIIGRYERAFSADPATVAVYAGAFVDGHRRSGVLTALKHFPGHGSSSGDTHEGFVDISANWRSTELVPFAELIASGRADMVMTGHLVRSEYEQAGVSLPASLSYRAVTLQLRDGLGFAGVVITDDMEMGAIREHFGRREAVIRAVNAGSDILLFSNTAAPSLGLAGEIVEILVAEAERDPAFRARIEQSFARIAALKSRLGRN